MIEAYVYDTLRTPLGKGKSTGALYEIKPVKLLSECLNAIQSRNQLNTAMVDDLIIGCASAVKDQGANIAQASLSYSGWSEVVPGFQLNRYGASGLEAINLGACKIRAGWENLIVAGGIESMSRVSLESDGGALLFDPEVMVKANYLPQGVAADLIATIEGYTREELDEFAYSSQQRASEAWTKGYYEKSIIPIHDESGLLVLDKDEAIRPDTNAEKLASLNPSFEEVGSWGFDTMALKKYPFVEKIKHLHTAGNSSGIVDGAALVLIGNKEMGERLGLKPRAKILSVGTASSDATIMFQGTIPATQKALKAAGLKVSDIDLWEVTEAFAAPVLKFQKEMGVKIDRLNINGGAIAMGHPLGATGAILLGTLLDELERQDLKRGGATTCVRGGMGVTTLIERV